MEHILNYFKDKGQPILDAVIILIVGWYSVKILLYFIMKMLKKSSIDPIVNNFIRSILDIAFKLIIIVTALAQLGVNTSSLVTVLATAGAALVLGLKDSMSGVVSGMIILFTKPFVKDDIIEVNQYIGRIEEIQLMYTILKTFDNKMVVIPNNELASSTFVNYSHEDKRRVDLTFDVHYKSDIELAKKVILDVVKAHPYGLKDPEPYVRVGSYNDSSISLNIRVWALTDEFYNLKDDLLEQIKVALDQNNIEIPYPQIEVHTKTPE